MARLIDDGTMDTVIECDTCHERTRFHSIDDNPDGLDRHSFIEECLADVDTHCGGCGKEED